MVSWDIPVFLWGRGGGRNLSDFRGLSFCGHCGPFFKNMILLKTRLTSLYSSAGGLTQLGPMLTPFLTLRDKSNLNLN